MLEAPITIVGGGPIGATLALGLARHQIPSIVVERISLSQMEQTPADGRALAIAAGSQQLLADIDAWDLLKTEAESILKILSINGNDGATLDFTTSSSNPMGYIVEMHLLRQALAKRVQQCKYINWLAPKRINSLELTSQNACIYLEDQTIQSMVVIAADGRSSTTRALASIEMKTKSYHQKAIVFTFQHTNNHYSIAFEKFLPTGTFAILPMSAQRSSVVWTVPDSLAEELLALSDAEFDQRFKIYVPEEYTNITRITQRWSYPLVYSFPDHYVKPRFALAGDAAHVVHPLAGQGLNLGFRDVKTIIELFTEGYRLGLDLGSITLLNRYAARRKPDHFALWSSTHLLNKLFSNNSVILDHLRNLGLSIFNNLSPLKKSAIQYAMGFSGKHK